MGHNSSRGFSGGHDTEAYFFEQTTFRKRPKRYQKQPDELPDDLKFAHLNPKVAAYLANNEKERLESTLGFDDGLGSKSLLPEINRTVSLLRNRLDSLLSSEENQHRQIFIDGKSAAPGLLAYLAKYLYLWEGLHVALPRSVESNLVCNFEQLVGEVYVIPRDWQLLSNKEEHLAKEASNNEAAQKAEDIARPDTVLSMSKSIDDVDPSVVKESTVDTRILSRTKSKLLSRTSTFGEINEVSDCTKKESPSRCASRQAGVDSMHKLIKKDSKSDIQKPKTRLDRFKGTHTDSKASGLDSRRGMRRDTDSVLGEPVAHENSKLLRGGAKDAGYYAVISFQLSNALCEELGWIVHPSKQEDPERATILEWATQRLQLSIKMKKVMDQELRDQGNDRPSIHRYYGDSRKEMVERYKARESSAGSLRNKPVYRGEKPTIPPLEGEPEAKEKNLFLVVTSDGASTVFYPSGHVAIIMCRQNSTNASGATEATTEKQDKIKSPPVAFYTIVYDDTSDKRMLGTFTPHGRNCIYYPNGKVRFLCDKAGGTVASDEGAIQRRWDWPSQTKMPVPVNFQVNAKVSFRCLGLQQMFLNFSVDRESYRVSVGAVPGCEEPSREQLGQLLSGSALTSTASQEFAKPYKRGSQQTKKKVLKSKKSRNDLEKLLNLPEDCENDEDADRDLYRLQRKAKNVVEDWLEHYRMALGVSSPYLKQVRDTAQPQGVRQIKSAKPGGGVVIIQRESTAVPNPRLGLRANSAGNGQQQRPLSGSAVERGVTARSRATAEPPHPGGTTAAAPGVNKVKFDDAVRVSEPELYAASRSNTGSLPGSAVSRSARAQSAPFGCRGSGVTCSLPVGATGGGNADLDTALSSSVALCPVALRLALLGHQRVVCRCSRHKIPHMSDVEFDEFIQRRAPEGQLVVVAVKSALSPTATPAEPMLESLHEDRNRNRTKPCMQSRADPYRLFWYDTVSSADFSDHAQPLLVRRHNVVPGMFLIYESGRLLFCDHIFNGYGNARKDFQKQLGLSRKAAMTDQALPKDFKFSGVSYSVNPTSTNSTTAVALQAVSFGKTTSFTIRPHSQTTFDADQARIQALTDRTKSTLTASAGAHGRMLPEIQSSA